MEVQISDLQDKNKRLEKELRHLKAQNRNKDVSNINDDQVSPAPDPVVSSDSQQGYAPDPVVSSDSQQGCVPAPVAAPHIAACFIFSLLILCTLLRTVPSCTSPVHLCRTGSGCFSWD